MAKITTAPLRRVLALSAVVLFSLLPGLQATAMESGGLFPALEAGRSGPEQRGMDEIETLPVRELRCPACAFNVIAPDADRLMRRHPGAAEPIRWRMHAASRDADFCPYPGPNKLAFQADVVICPSCGFAAHGDEFLLPLAPETIAWIMSALKPNLRTVQRAILGPGGDRMAEEEISAFFNRQEEIPDSLRLEHARLYALASEKSGLARAEATWLAAWAVRREIAAPPKGEFLAQRAAAVQAILDKANRTAPGLSGEAGALTRLLGRNRSGKDRLAPPERMAARFMLAGLHARLGFGEEAEKELEELRLEFHERFLHPDQDPLWSATAGKIRRDRRMANLEAIRNEAERETTVRLEQTRLERDLLNKAADLIRGALLAGECNGKPDEARRYAYLTGEFLRRGGDYPLAAEWFRNLLSLTAENDPLFTAAREQVLVLEEQAGNKVNLLSALGRDGEAFETLRRICDNDSGKK